MSDRKEQILLAALSLFANEGYNAVPTSRIAKQAGVSEGLIFRHYKNKEGLLNAIIALATERTGILFAPVITAEKPEEAIRLTIDLPFSVPKTDHPFWRLQFKLKWEIEYDSSRKMKPLLDKLTWAFDELGYENPKEEAQTLNHLIESIAAAILREGIAKQRPLHQFLLNKYRV